MFFFFQKEENKGNRTNKKYQKREALAQMLGGLGTIMVRVHESPPLLYYIEKEEIKIRRCLSYKNNCKVPHKDQPAPISTITLIFLNTPHQASAKILTIPSEAAKGKPPISNINIS